MFVAFEPVWGRQLCAEILPKTEALGNSTEGLSATGSSPLKRTRPKSPVLASSCSRLGSGNGCPF
jgi:hypothetical protein